MATVNAGVVEAVLRLKDEATAIAVKVDKVVEALEPKVKRTAQAVDSWSEANQRAALKMERIHEQALAMNNDLSMTNDGALRMSKSIELAGQTIQEMGKATGVTNDLLESFGQNGQLAIAAGNALGPAVAIASVGMEQLKTATVAFNAATIGLIGAAFAIGAAIGGWIAKFEVVKKSVDALAVSIVNLFRSQAALDAEFNATQGLKAFHEQIKKTADEALAKQAKQLLANGVALKDLEKHFQPLTEAEKKLIGVTDQQVQAHNKAEAAVKKHSEALRDMLATIKGEGTEDQTKAINAISEAVTRIGGPAKLTAEQFIRVRVELLKLGPAGEELRKTFDLMAGYTIPTMRRGFENLIPPIQQIKRGTMETHNIMERIPSIAARIGASLKTNIGAALEGLPGVILGAIQGGGDVGKAIGAHLGGSIGQSLSESLGSKLTGALGKTLGGALNSLLPGLGALAGSLIGKGLSALGGALGIGGDKIIMQVNDLRDAFFEAHGGFEALAASLARTGDDALVKRIFDARTVEEFNALVKETESILGLQSQSQELLNQAVERYGFTIDELGPKFQQQKLDEMAGQLLQDYSLLIASGIDMNTVIARMGPAFNDYVNTAIKAGVAIPENLRPIIQQLIDQGKLLDENGNAFTSVEDAGISFTESLSEGLSRAIDAINRLVEALTGIPTSRPPIHVPVVYDDPGAPGGHHGGSHGGEVPSYAGGSGGFRDFGAGTLAMLHGSEAVIPENKAGAAFGMAGGLSEEGFNAGLEAQARSFARLVRDGMLQAKGGG